MHRVDCCCRVRFGSVSCQHIDFSLLFLSWFLHLGPLLFIVYMNDLPLHIHNDIDMFANDSTLHTSGANIEEIQLSLQTDLNVITTCGRYYEHSLSSLSAIYLTKWLRRSYVSIMSITKPY